MGVLLITCPNTGREFSTGIHADADTFNSLPDVLVQSHCPHCGLQHNWWKREARLMDSIEPAQWIEAMRGPWPIARRDQPGDPWLPGWAETVR